MSHTIKLSKLMKMSWAIQRRKQTTRANALRSAWAIISNEDVTIHYLVRKLSPRRAVSPKALNQFTLFNL